jgi:N-acetylneuraminic acid mutarotase
MSQSPSALVTGPELIEKTGCNQLLLRPSTLCMNAPGLSVLGTVKSLSTPRTGLLAVLSLVLLALGWVCPEATAQSNEGEWIKGPKTPQLSVYGTMGVPAPNNLPGTRSAAVSWTASQGNFWLFGGWGSDSVGRFDYLNDLWQYSPSTNEWAWMGGSNRVDSVGVPGTLGTPAAGNVPGSRFGAVGWTDARGNLWLFGGNFGSVGSDLFNDLWEFNPSTNEWAWMSGSNSTTSCTKAECGQPGVYGKLGTAATGNGPGSRMNAVSWTDNQGELWLFGGYGLDSTGILGYLNDLWEFNPATDEWTWMSGSNTVPSCSTGNCGALGVYGVEGIPTAGNAPGGRNLASSWVDGKGNLWLFGGLGVDSAGNFGLLNDVWEFSPSISEWTWAGGSNTIPASCAGSLADECGQPGVYGTLGTPAAGNIPGQRDGSATWTDGKGNLWLFGGNGIDSAGKWGYLNDFWEFNPSTSDWAWMGGGSKVVCASVYCGQPGVYGSLQTPALGNAPSSRSTAMTWTDPKGDFWLFGGEGIDVTGSLDFFQDLWEFQPNTSGSLPVTATPTFSPGPGTYTGVQAVTIDDVTSGATIYYLVNGNTPSSQYIAPIPVSSSETIEAIAGAGGYANSNVASAAYVVQVVPAATPTFSAESGTYATAQTVTISDATPGATVYYTTDGTAPTTASTMYVSPITVSASETVLAIAVASGFSNSAIESAVYTIGSNSTLGEWTWIGGSSVEGKPGVYGSFLTPAPANIPGARSNAESWTDQSGNFWLFGGGGYDANGSQGDLNDLWEFNPSSREWAWMAEAVQCHVRTH